MEIIQATTISSFPQLKRHKGKNQSVFSRTHWAGPQSTPSSVCPSPVRGLEVWSILLTYLNNSSLLKQWSNIIKESKVISSWQKSVFSLCVCMCVLCVCSCVYRCMCVHIHTEARGQLWVSLGTFSLSGWGEGGKGLALTWNLPSMPARWPVWPQDPPHTTSSYIFYVGSRNQT